MSISDIVILAVVLTIALLCVRSIIRANKAGECGGCALEGGCSAHGTGHCEISEALVARADAAVAKFEAERAKKA